MTLEQTLAISEGKGYAVTISRGSCMEIQAVDEKGVFDDDEKAVEAAIKDGIPIIPIEQLPENFEFKYPGWVDTKENRQAIQEYALNFAKEG